ncbi:MAG: hypothetical protein OEY34_03870 [Cyclobacteriaceae bacterium]|nr:hypothetical protein [Cyclobacteriaceae bacterium]
MKKYFKIILISSVLSFLGTTYTNAQNYNTGIGVRMGLFQGLNIKHFIGSDRALEGILSTRGSTWNGNSWGWNIAVLYEIDKPINGVDGLSWFYGFGGHIVFANGTNNGWWNDTNDHIVIGVDGIIGLDYTIPNAPLSLQLDYKPAFNLTDPVGWWGEDLALSIRFVF